MFPTVLDPAQQDIVDSGTSGLTNVGLAMAAVAVGGLVIVGLRAVYKSVTTAIASRGRSI